MYPYFFISITHILGKLRFVVALFFRTPVVDVRYDLRPREKRKYLD